jgi:hypothetical protein
LGNHPLAETNNKSLYRRSLHLTVTKAQTAVSRMSFLGTPVPLWKFMLVWPIPVYLLMIHDFYKKRLIRSVYLIGVAAMLTMRLILPIGSSHAWQSIAAVITAFYRATLG